MCVRHVCVLMQMRVSNMQIGHLEGEVFLWLTDPWPGAEPRKDMKTITKTIQIHNPMIIITYSLYQQTNQLAAKERPTSIYPANSS